MTSALYPYVHTRACGMSKARYSSGQKTVAGDGNGDARLAEDPCVCSVSVPKDLPVRLLNKDLSPLDFLVTSLLPMLVSADVSQVPRE
jgi:hypothetical protein